MALTCDDVSDDGLKTCGRYAQFVVRTHPLHVGWGACVDHLGRVYLELDELSKTQLLVEQT